jgi:hypothetical protein
VGSGGHQDVRFQEYALAGPGKPIYASDQVDRAFDGYEHLVTAIAFAGNKSDWFRRQNLHLVMRTVLPLLLNHGESLRLSQSQPQGDHLS